MKRLCLYTVDSKIYPELILTGADSGLFQISFSKSMLNISREGELIGSINVNRGKCIYKGDELLVKVTLKKIEIHEKKSRNVSISTTSSSKWCEPLSYNIFINSKKVAYFRVASKYIFFDRRFEMLYQNSCDLDFMVMLMAFLYNETSNFPS